MSVKAITAGDMFYGQTDPAVFFRNSGILITTELVWPASSDKW